MRFIFPNLQIGPNKLILLGVIFLAVILVKQRKTFLLQFKFDKLEILALIFIILTIITRLIVLKEPSISRMD